MKKIIALTLAASAATAMAATSFAAIGGNTTNKPGEVAPGTSRPGSIEGAGDYALDFSNISGNGSIDKGTVLNTLNDNKKIELTTVLANGYQNVEQINNDGISFHYNLLKNENNVIANVELKNRPSTTRTAGVEFYIEASTRNAFKASSAYEIELILVNNKTGANTKTRFNGKVEYNKQTVNFNGNNMVFNAIPVYEFGSNYTNTTNKVNFTFDSANGSYNFVTLDVVPAHDYGKKFMGYTQEIPSSFVAKYDSSYRMQGFRLLDDSLTFGLGATLTFDAAKLNATEAYLYELANDGTLREIGRTTTGKIIVNEYSRVGGKQYILSNKVLGATTTPETTPSTPVAPAPGDTGTKPPANTGASSDVVNAAVAMSVVALAAAGAVAFKKASK